MAFGQKEVTVWFQADQRSAGIPYRRIPSHFEPWFTPAVLVDTMSSPVVDVTRAGPAGAAGPVI